MKRSNKIRQALVASLLTGLGFSVLIQARENPENHEYAGKNNSSHESHCRILLAKLEKDFHQGTLPSSEFENLPFDELIKYDLARYRELINELPEDCDEKFQCELTKLHLDLISLIMLKKVCIIEAFTRSVHCEKDFLEKILRMDAKVLELYDRFEAKNKESCNEPEEGKLPKIKILSDRMKTLDSL
jgi:hypothetical protein